jgi:phospholipase/carboxylesterase
MAQLEIAGLKTRITGGDGPLTVVLLHGFGAPGDDLVPLAGEIDAPPGTRFVFPEAPILLPYELGGGVGRAWWLIDIVRIQMAMMTGQVRDLMNEVPEGLDEAREQLERFLAELVDEHGAKRESLVLGGFSQGAMLSCDTALRSDVALAGLVLLSGTYLAASTWTPLMPKRAGLRVLQSHGSSDPLLPYVLAEKLRDSLREAGLDVTWVSFPGGHGIAPQVLDALSTFLSER